MIGGLIALPAAALLHLLALLGVGRAWPAMVHLTLFGYDTFTFYLYVLAIIRQNP